MGVRSENVTWPMTKKGAKGGQKRVMTCIYVSQRKSNEPNLGDWHSLKRNKCSRSEYRHMLRSSNVSLHVFHRLFPLRILLLLEM